MSIIGKDKGLGGVLTQNFQSYNIENQSILTSKNTWKILCPTWNPCKAQPLILRKFQVKKSGTIHASVRHQYSNRCVIVQYQSARFQILKGPEFEPKVKGREFEPQLGHLQFTQLVVGSLVSLDIVKVQGAEKETGHTIQRVCPSVDLSALPQRSLEYGTNLYLTVIM